MEEDQEKINDYLMKGFLERSGWYEGARKGGNWKQGGQKGGKKIASQGERGCRGRKTKEYG